MKDFRSRFGFHVTPFTREIDVKDRFLLEDFDQAFEGMVRTLDERMSCALIAGPGTGKTSILRAVVKKLPEARYRIHYVKVTHLSKRDMCREIAAAVGASPAGTFPSLVRKLQEHFIVQSETDGLRTVLILDDAHEMRPDVLSILRILTNFDMDSRLVVSFILVGQEPLRALLRRSELEDVARRIAHYAALRHLSRDEIARYIEHRCTVAGAMKLPFDQQAIEAVYEIGHGNLRATDHLALKSLEVAHDQDDDLADHNHVAKARKMLWP